MTTTPLLDKAIAQPGTGAGWLRARMALDRAQTAEGAERLLRRWSDK